MNKNERKIRRLISDMLITIGIYPNICGYNVALEVIYRCVTTHVVHLKLSTADEKLCYTALTSAYSRGKLEKLDELLGLQVTSHRLTVSEFIHLSAECVRRSIEDEEI